MASKISKLGVLGGVSLLGAAYLAASHLAIVDSNDGQVCRVESDGASIIDPSRNFYGEEFATMEITKMGEDGPVKGDAIYNKRPPVLSGDVKGGFTVTKDACYVKTDGKDQGFTGWLTPITYKFPRQDGPL